MERRVSDNRGFAALGGVLIFGGFAVVMTSAMVFSGMRSMQVSLILRQAYEARTIARACAETALRAIHDSTGYVGSGSVTLGTGTCTYTVASGGAAVRTLDISASVGRIVQSLTITTDQLSPIIHVSSWRET